MISNYPSNEELTADLKRYGIVNLIYDDAVALIKKYLPEDKQETYVKRFDEHVAKIKERAPKSDVVFLYETANFTDTISDVRGITVYPFLKTSEGFLSISEVDNEHVDLSRLRKLMNDYLLTRKQEEALSPDYAAPWVVLTEGN